MENDDVMWNWNNNRFHGDNKELKLKYFFYLHPEFYGKYDNFDDEMDCIIDYLRQKELNPSKIICIKLWRKPSIISNIFCIIFLL